MAIIISLLTRFWWIIPIAGAGAWGEFENIRADRAVSQIATVQAGFDKFKLAQANLAAKQSAKIAQTELFDANLSAASARQFQNQIEQLRKENHAHTSVASGIVCAPAPALGVRHNHSLNSSSDSVSSSSATPISPDAVSANSLADFTANQVSKLPDECAVTTQMLVDLQAWVTGVSKQ